VVSYSFFKEFPMQKLRLIVFLPILWLALGCGSQPPEPPSLDDAATRAAIEEEDAQVYEEESQQ
jgi:hypothetical protein